MLSLLVVAGGALLVAVAGEVALMSGQSRRRAAIRPCGSVGMQPPVGFWEMDLDSREIAP